MSKQRMSFKDAMALVPDDLPDGAFFAMAHELAGLEYGDGFAELDDKRPTRAKYVAAQKNAQKTVICTTCHKKFVKDAYMRQHVAAAHARKP